MSLIEDEFPDRRLIWPGAILGSIAHAIFVCRYPDLSHEQSWDGSNYNVQDSAGSRGTISFAGEKFVAVFFLEGSSRNPFHSESHYDLNDFLRGLPDDLQSLAQNEALQYILQEYNGSTIPIITSAFWGDGKNYRVAAAEPWAEVFDHGAALIKNQLLNPNAALANWVTDYELKQSEVALVRALFDRKMATPNQPIEFGEHERHLWTDIALGQDGAEASRESFAEIGIVLP